MSVHTLSVAALFFTGLVGAAVSAPLPVNFDGAAFIQGHDAHSRFLPGAYVVSPGATDGGSPPSGINPAQSFSSYTPSVDSKTFVVMPPARSKMVAFTWSGLISSDISDPGIPGSQGGNAGAVFSGTGPDNGDAIESSPTHVGAVPLPPALPLFGAAVLGLAIVGRARRRHAARR